MSTNTTSPAPASSSTTGAATEAQLIAGPHNYPLTTTMKGKTTECTACWWKEGPAAYGLHHCNEPECVWRYIPHTRALSLGTVGERVTTVRTVKSVKTGKTGANTGSGQGPKRIQDPPPGQERDKGRPVCSRYEKMVECLTSAYADKWNECPHFALDGETVTIKSVYSEME